MGGAEVVEVARAVLVKVRVAAINPALALAVTASAQSVGHKEPHVAWSALQRSKLSKVRDKDDT